MGGGVGVSEEGLVLLLDERVGGAAEVAGAAGLGGGAGIGGGAGFAGALLGALPPLGDGAHQGRGLDVLLVLLRFFILVVPFVVFLGLAVVGAGVAGDGRRRWHRGWAWVAEALGLQSTREGGK